MGKLITALNALFGILIFILLLVVVYYLPDAYVHYSNEPEDLILIVAYLIFGTLMIGTCVLNVALALLPDSFGRGRRGYLLVVNCIWVVSSTAILVLGQIHGENQQGDPVSAIILASITTVFSLNCWYQFTKNQTTNLIRNYLGGESNYDISQNTSLI